MALVHAANQNLPGRGYTIVTNGTFHRYDAAAFNGQARLSRVRALCIASRTRRWTRRASAADSSPAFLVSGDLERFAMQMIHVASCSA